MSEEGGGSPTWNEKEIRYEVSRAVSRELHYDHDKKVWYTQSELCAKLKELKRFQYDDESVLQTMQGHGRYTKRSRLQEEGSNDFSARDEKDRASKKQSGRKAKAENADERSTAEENDDGKSATRWRNFGGAPGFFKHFLPPRTPWKKRCVLPQVSCCFVLDVI